MEYASRRPFVTLKIAQSLDGRVATATGHSQWITGLASRREGHRLRAEHDAVLVGVGTVIADDPRLTVRLVEGHNPMRVVLDAHLRIPPQASVLVDGAAQTVVLTTQKAPRERVSEIARSGVEVRVIAEHSGTVDLRRALDSLQKSGIESVLIEGGPRVATSALRERLVDQLALFIAPKILGAGVSAVGDLGIERVTEALSFSGTHIQVLDGDILFRGRVYQDGE